MQGFKHDICLDEKDLIWTSLPKCISSCLKTLTFHNLHGNDSEICFLKCVLQHALVFEKMIIICCENLLQDQNRQKEVKKALKTIAKGSKSRVVTFLWNLKEHVRIFIVLFLLIWSSAIVTSVRLFCWPYVDLSAGCLNCWTVFVSLVSWSAGSNFLMMAASVSCMLWFLFLTFVQAIVLMLKVYTCGRFGYMWVQVFSNIHIGCSCFLFDVAKLTLCKIILCF